MKSSLTSLRNIGRKSASWLESVGIQSPEELFDLGPVEAYKRLKSARPNEVSLNMLYALQGAILDLPWNELPPDVKDKLKREVAE
jgi:DNA transformation protein